MCFININSFVKYLKGNSINIPYITEKIVIKIKFGKDVRSIFFKLK